jgi:predicted metal-dependent hydrolase
MLPTGAELVPVRVRRSSQARRLTLRVSDTQRDVFLTLPNRASLASALAFLQQQKEWIADCRAAWAPLVPLADGSLMPLRGVPHRIRRVEGPGEPETIDGPQPELVVPSRPERLHSRLLAFLRAQARRDLQAAVGRHAAVLGLPLPAVRIGDPRSRWGSCSAKGSLSFSWRLILAPPHVLRYVAAHEVAHLRELNHSQRFWGLVMQLDPEYRAAEAWLKRHAAGLHRYAFR